MTGGSDLHKVNLGCGNDYRDGWVNIDYTEEFRPDDEGSGRFVLHDLEETPWPFEDNAFEYALVDNVFEHIDPHRRPAFVSEVRRIVADGGTLVMRLPTHTGWDVTHYAVPAWNWANHPRHDGQWSYTDVSVVRTIFGKPFPTRIVLELLKYDFFWCASEVELTLE